MNKKGEDTMLNVLIGVIVGVIMIIGIFSVAKSFIRTDEKYEDSFLAFAQDIQDISKENTYASKNSLLTLKENSAVIGLNPVRPEIERQGRIGDGDFHYVVNDETLFTAQGWLGQKLEDVLTEPKSFLKHTHFARPDQCSAEKSCVCLCTDLALFQVTQSYLTDKNNPDYYRSEDTRWFGFRTTASVDQSKMISCGEITCQELDNTHFYPIMKNDYYSQYFSHYKWTDYDKATWITRQVLSPTEWYINYQRLMKLVTNNLYSSKYSEPVPDYTFENGFAFYNAPDSYQGLRTIGYSEDALDSVPVWIEKLKNGEVAVCLDSLCGEAIKWDLLTWETQTYGLGVRKPTLNPMRRTGTTEVDAPSGNGEKIYIFGESSMQCEVPPTQPSVGAQDELFKIIDWLSQGSSFSTEYPIPSETWGSGLENNIFIRLFSYENKVDVELLYKCSADEYVFIAGQTLIQPTDTLLYEDYCEQPINILLKAEDNIALVSVPVTYPPNIDLSLSQVPMYITCVYAQ